MSVRRHAAACLAALLVLALAGCRSSEESANDDAKAASDKASSKPSPSASQAPCAEDAKCFDFARSGSGWTESDEAGYYAKQDDYLDGSFRMTAREAGTWHAAAPVKVTDLANDYGVRIEADAVMGQDFPGTAAWGASCWTGATDSAGPTGFGVYVQPGAVTVGVWSDGGEFKPLKSRDVSKIVKPAEKNHLALSCRQDTSNGPVEAAIGVELNGSSVLSTSYAKSVQNVSWEVGDGVGLLVAGKGGDVFYDDVVVTGKCDGDFC
jgi:hypothetical protein